MGAGRRRRGCAGGDADLAVWDGTRLLGREEFARRLPELETKAS
ncbi:MAG: hypothetical protein M0Z27_00170 [Thermaerobacter sp.]|nr:hypothetical protein [Thermaerobacter sp.]